MIIAKNIVLLLLMLLLVYWVAAQEPGRYDVVIHEIFADPTPSRGMPASEFIEIRNRTRSDWNLRNWGVTNGSTTGRVNTNYILRPDSTVTLCSSSSFPAFLGFGNALALSGFPTLDNDGDTLILLSPAGNVVHAVAWNKDWYRDDVKQEGGWTIEMMDVNRPCLGKENWGASKDPRGGTPGRKNSISSALPYSSHPALLYSYMPDSLSVELVFSEPIREAAAASIVIGAGLTAVTASLKPPLFDALIVKLSGTTKESETYNISVSGVSDCSGNITAMQTLKTGRFSIPNEKDVVINEILFNPPSGGHDYVELFNRSDKNIDVGKLLLANRDGNNRISSISPISSFPYPLFPSEYIALTTGESWIRKKYMLPNQAKILELVSLPTYPDEEGEVVLLNQRALQTDELNYEEKWHFELISEHEGISLERVSVNGPTQNAANWHSASTSSGYGTPGYRNSQSWPGQTNSGSIHLSTALISPDMDGRDDFVLINYEFPKPGNVATIMVYDSQGRAVRTVAKSSLCGRSGFFRWDGLSETGGAVPRGVYIILAEYFDIQGRTQRIKRTVGVHR
jgi:Lamin Tail Domain